MIYFFLYLFLEVMISSAIIGEIGGLITFAELVLSAMIGVFLLQNFQFGLLEKINSVRTGEMSQDEFIKGSIGSAIGAVCLIIPGFFTDILGLLLQFTVFTVLFSKLFKFKSKPRASNNQSYSQTSYTYTEFNNKNKGDHDVIDVEIIDNDKSIRH